MKKWKKLSTSEIKNRVFNALEENANYTSDNVLGVPASLLDQKVFYGNASFIKDAPLLSTMLQNPNHIGCHTLESSESFFSGTQKLEKEVIEICANNILNNSDEDIDGYITSGGTEANIQALWIYRNYYKAEFNAKNEEIAIVFSEDTHYSMYKGADLLQCDILVIPVEKKDRTLDINCLRKELQHAIANGKKYFICVANMMTTMFGSVDDIDSINEEFQSQNCEFKLHVDGAYGGFIYPFSRENHKMDFSNKNINSVTLDAHKMVQAPYGTGIFLIRKGWMKYTRNVQASYVEGEDYTLVGSRSGSNAVAVWMILMTYGPYGWKEKILILLHRTNWFCEQLKKLKVDFYRNPAANICTIKAKYVSPELAKKYGLVPDNHQNPTWYKVIIMEHVTVEKMMPFLNELKNDVA